MEYLRARKNEEKDQRRVDILEAARRLFADQGIEITTLDQIAKGARLSRSLIYTYFLDKDHIYVVTVANALGQLIEDFEQAIADTKSGILAIERLGEAYIRFAQTHPDYFSATMKFQFSDGRSKGLEPNEAYLKDLEILRERADKINRLLADQIERGTADGSIRKDVGDPLKTALVLWATTSGLIQTAMSKGEMLSLGYGIELSTFLRHGLDLIKRGLEPK